MNRQSSASRISTNSQPHGTNKSQSSRVKQWTLAATILSYPSSTSPYEIRTDHWTRSSRPTAYKVQDLLRLFDPIRSRTESEHLPGMRRISGSFAGAQQTSRRVCDQSRPGYPLHDRPFEHFCS